MSGVTVAELDALPEGSIVLTNPPMCYVKVESPLRGAPAEWRSPYRLGPKQWRTSPEVARVATRVIYNPADDKAIS